MGLCLDASDHSQCLGVANRHICTNVADEAHLACPCKQLLGKLDAHLLAHHEAHAAEVAHVDFRAIAGSTDSQVIRMAVVLSRFSFSIISGLRSDWPVLSTRPASLTRERGLMMAAVGCGALD